MVIPSVAYFLSGLVSSDVEYWISFACLNKISVSSLTVSFGNLSEASRTELTPIVFIS